MSRRPRLQAVLERMAATAYTKDRFPAGIAACACVRLAGTKGSSVGLVQRKGDWLSAMVGEELVMMSPERGAYLGLSAVGARIWELIEEPREADAICAKLTEEFEVEPATCHVEVMQFLEDLAKNGAIQMDVQPAR